MVEKKVGSVLVIGSGIGGIQASLDLVEQGFKVILVEKNPALGGAMAQLDKTFPTNDCSMCILAPKMVEVARDPNIDLYTYSEVVDITGEAGNFEVTVLKKARFIDQSKCVACGSCSRQCPIRVPSDYNKDLSYRPASFIPFPQAVPSTYLIDKNNCLFLTRGICKICEKVCNAHAIDFNQKDELMKLNVGSVIIALGAETFDASTLYQYRYKVFPNIITSLEFERILNASGPFGGHVVRPSDETVPKKILWVSCVGSRNSRINHNYCSSVCCTYSIKEALIAKEHNPDLECYFAHIDVRTMGKGFEEYYVSAKNFGINFINSQVSFEENPINDNIIAIYEDMATGTLVQNEFELVVLSVGLQPSKATIELLSKFGIELDRYQFCQTQTFSPIETNRPGIYVCGTLSGPKDIPETVAEASGAAAKASSIIHAKRFDLITERQFPEELKFEGQNPRIGVFVCHCGINIGSVVNVPEVAKFVKTLPNVAYVEENLYTCSQDTQEKIQDVIKKKNLNRVVVASCTPRTHEPLFQNTIREAGLNPYLFELANIREHCSWVHMTEPEKATEKAKEIVAMSVLKVALSEPLHEAVVDITRSGLVIGGGVAGLTAALDLANQDYSVYLIEKESELGGLVRNLNYMLGDDDPHQYLSNLIDRVKKSDKITVFLNTKIEEISGFVGNFRIRINTQGETKEFEAGAIIVATGGNEYKPTEYLYGKDERILTQHELEKQIPHKKIDAKTVVMIQCVGSRNKDRPYCSKICCATAIKNALKLKESDPKRAIYVIYRDIRTYGLQEDYYREARRKGVVFIKYDPDRPPEVTKDNGALKILVMDAALQRHVSLKPDLVVLSAAFIPTENKDLSQMLKVPLDQNGFFLEAHVKLRPLDFATDGIFLCGTAQWPKPIKESIAQASGAASRAIRILSAKNIKTDAVIAIVDQTLCMGCGSCEMICPFHAPHVERTELGRKSSINPSACKGCGTCGASCPQKAISMQRFTDIQIFEQLKTISEKLMEREI